jgi:hypothetical protein
MEAFAETASSLDWRILKLLGVRTQEFDRELVSTA